MVGQHLNTDGKLHIHLRRIAGAHKPQWKDCEALRGGWSPNLRPTNTHTGDENMTLKRETYIACHPNGERYTGEHALAYIAPYKRGPGYVVLGWSGRRNKPDVYQSAADRECALKVAQDHIARVAKFEADKAERRARAKAANSKPHTLKVGDLLSSSWGYDQTNVDFYEVTAVTGKSAKVRKIAQNTVETGFMAGHTTPCPGNYVGEETNWKRVRGKDNSIKVRDWGVWAHPTNGEKKYCSWYH